MDERMLRAVLKFGMDQGSLEKVKKGTMGVQDALKQVEAQAAKTAERMELLANVGVSMAKAGAVMTAAITVPLLAMGRSYTQYAGQVDDVSRRWIAAAGGIEKAQMRIGRVVADQVNPALEAAQGIVEATARIAEKHPGMIGKMLGAGVVLAQGGGLVALLARGIQLVADARQLIAAKLMDTAANKQLAAAGMMAGASTGSATAAGATVAGAAGKAGGWLGKALAGTWLGGLLGKAGLAVGGISAGTLAGLGLAGTGLGLGAWQGLSWMSGGKVPGLGKYATVGAYKLGEMLGGEGMGKEWALEIAKLTGELDDLGYAAGKAALETERARREMEEGAISTDMVKLFIDYKKEREQADKEYEERKTEIEEAARAERLKLTRKYERQVTEITQQYAQQRAELSKQFQQNTKKLREDYQRQEAEAKRAYQQQRADLARQYNLELGRIVSAFQRTMKRLTREHTQSMEELEANRDALGMAREQRRFEQEKAEAEEQYAEERAQNREAYRQALEDLDRSFAEQEAQRREEYQRQQDELKKNYQEELTQLQQKEAEELRKLQEGYKEQLDELEKHLADEKAALLKGYNEQMDAIEQTFRDRLRDLNQYILGDYEEYQKYLKDMANELRNYLNMLKTGRPLDRGVAGGKNKQSGGYTTGLGRYWMHEAGEEYVLSHATTRAAERLAGGRLTQERLLAAMANNPHPTLSLSGRGGGGSVFVTLNVEGALSEGERRMLRRDIGRQVEEAFVKVVGSG